MENYIIREASLYDTYSIFEINKQLTLNFCSLRCVDYFFINDRVRRKKFYVLEYENTVVAAISVDLEDLFKNNSLQFIIDSIAIKKEYHKRGLGTILIDYVLDNVWDNIVHNEIYVGTFEEYNVLNFYIKYGFEIEEIYNDVYDDNKRHKVYLLRMSREKYESKKYNGKLY